MDFKKIVIWQIPVLCISGTGSQWNYGQQCYGWVVSACWAGHE